MTREKLYVLWIGMFLLDLPLALNLVPPNGAVGFRTAKTLSSPVVWRQANAFAGWVFVAGAVIGLGITYFKPDVAKKFGLLLFLGIVGLALAISFIYINVLPG